MGEPHLEQYAALGRTGAPQFAHFGVEASFVSGLAVRAAPLKANDALEKTPSAIGPAAFESICPNANAIGACAIIPATLSALPGFDAYFFAISAICSSTQL
jgi:hypothetical protein